MLLVMLELLAILVLLAKVGGVSCIFALFFLGGGPKSRTVWAIPGGVWPFFDARRALRRGGVFSGREVRGSATAGHSAAICNPILPSPQLTPVTSEWVRKGPITFVPMPSCAAPAGAAQDQFCGNYFFKKGRNFFRKKHQFFVFA